MHLFRGPPPRRASIHCPHEANKDREIYKSLRHQTVIPPEWVMAIERFATYQAESALFALPLRGSRNRWAALDSLAMPIRTCMAVAYPWRELGRTCRYNRSTKAPIRTHGSESAAS